MTKNPTTIFQHARELFLNGSFAEAEKEIQNYQNCVDYESMSFTDRRLRNSCVVSIVIVSYDQGQDLLQCINSITSQVFAEKEILLIDNGKNESIYDELNNLNIFHFQSPINFTPSEARNIGAHFANGKILVFIDDDCLIGSSYLDEIVRAFESFDFLAIRGRILPKSTEGNRSAPRHYDLGNYPIPAPLVTEGNMAIPKEVYRQVGGMNPLMFGLEGIEFTLRLQQHFPKKDIYYWPNMTILHDHVAWHGRAEKKKRHAIARSYLKHCLGTQADLTAQFNQWYDDRPGPSRRYESRSALTRWRQVVLDGLVAFLYGRKR